MSLQFQFPLWTFSTWYIFYFWNPYRELWFQGSPLIPHKILVVPRPIEFSNVVYFFFEIVDMHYDFKVVPWLLIRLLKVPRPIHRTIFEYLENLFLKYLEYLLFLKSFPDSWFQGSLLTPHNIFYGPRT